MKRLLGSLLSFLLPTTAMAQAYDWKTDPIESHVGIHVISDFGKNHTVYSRSVSEVSIRAVLRSVDWINGFHQIVVVSSPGISMEVGGSLNPEDGLSGVYRDHHRPLRAVTKEAPQSVSDMEVILIAFTKPEDEWKHVQEFVFYPNWQ